MAYVNVAEWKTEQVCEWLKGLDNSVLPYVHSFTNHNVSGQQLLSLRPDDLEHLGVLKLGHQEIILEAVEYLRNFHYELDRENLQLLALRLSCQAHSLQNELSRQTDSKPVKTQTLSDVASVIMAVKPLVRWLDRPPFSGQLEYNDKKAELMKLALEMATCAQRDRFAEKPIEEIRTICGQLAKLADYIIQDINDPMILQPSSLDLATLKKKPGDDLGFYILPSFHGAHQIAEIKFGSAAHQCGKMEEGDEIVQVNYQTVVGWERKNLLELFRESPAEILLTLKRRPRHTKVYGQIYIKPYRLPSNKKTCYTTRWQHNLPSPRPELLTIPDFTMPLPRPKNPSPEPVSILDTANILDTLIIDSSDSDSETEPPLSIRLYSTKPRNSVQRRATITGASPTTKHGIDIEQFWKELKQEHSTTSQLRDKAASCAHGLDNMPSNIRAQTCIEQSKWKKRSNMQNEDKKVQFQDKFSKCDVSHRDNSAISITNEKRNEAKAVQNNDELLTTSSVGTLSQISQTSTNVTNNHTTSDTSVPLDECNNFIRDKHTNNRNIISSKETSVCSGKERGRLDKSYSAPAYDSMDSDGEMEHRRQKLFLTTESSASNVSSVSIKTDIQTTSASTEEERMLKDADDQKQGIQVNFDSNTINTSDDIHRCVTKEKDNKSCSQSSEHLDLSHAGAHKVVEGSPKISIEDNQSNNKCIITTSIVCNKKNVTYNMNHKIGNANETHETENVYNPSLNHEIIDDKLESTNSSTQNDKENDRYTCQYGKILQTFTPIVQVCGKNATKTTEHITQNFVKNIPSTQISQSIQNDQLKVNDSIYHENIMQTCKDAEARKAELCKNVETNPNLIPPDPPPRKYFTRIEFNRSSNDTSLMAEEHEKSIPEKRNIRQDLKNVEYCMDNYVKSNSDHEHTQDYFYACNSFTEKLEYIDFANTFTDERRPSLDTDSSHSEYNDKQIRENKSVCDKYEPVTEKSVYVNSTTPFHDPENCFYRENMDSPDGSCTSKQFLEHTKSKVTEKEKGFEKGVVNKAMMVARSIGLHGSLSKSSSNSPRSNRKRSILIARKRNISVKDIGTGDLEGWLTYRSRGAGGAWAKAWFVLKCSSLYRFKIQNSIKADCLIVLTGFTVARASEVKSRKFAFKVYHTGTVFYFAADTEDSLTSWLDAISKATLGADSHSRNSALFSETDESDDEQKSKKKTVHSPEYKPNTEKSFGSLKKIVRKDSSSYKEQEMSGASLDRKYLKFLGTKHHNIPVPTAQFRSYRRVLPTSTTNKKQDSVPNSPDLQMTIAGSTFYGLCASHSATDMSYGTPDMCDYRRTTDRSLSNRNRRPEELQGFITLEEFMLNQQEDQNQMARNRPVSPRITPLTGDHVHVQHRNFHNNDVVDEQSRISIDTNSSTAVHSRNRNNDEILIGTHLYGYSQNTDAQHGMRKYNTDFDFERNEYRSELQRPSTHKNLNDFSYIGKKKSTDNMHFQATKACNLPHCKNGANKEKSLNSFSRNKLMTSDKSERQMATSCEYNVNSQMNRGQSSSNHEIYRMYDYYFSRNANHSTDHVKSAPRCLVRKDGSSGSSHDLTYHNTSETLKRAKKEASINRKGSFNLSTRRNSSEKHWLDSLRRIDEKDTNCEKMKLKNVAQYQPPPIPSSPYEQEGMSAAFEMHLDRGEQIQKTKRLKNLFGNKSQQKPSTLDLPKDTQKTLLGSPRLHRALFRDKCCNQSRASSKLQSPRLQPVTSFNGNNPSMINQIGNSVSSASDSSPDTPPQHTPHFILKDCVNHPCQKGQTSSGRNFLAPPTLPYIPPPTSPPPDYPGLEYPPVFEPGTYSLLDASLLRNRNKSSRDTTH